MATCSLLRVKWPSCSVSREAGSTPRRARGEYRTFASAAACATAGALWRPGSTSSRPRRPEGPCGLSPRECRPDREASLSFMARQASGISGHVELIKRKRGKLPDAVATGATFARRAQPARALHDAGRSRLREHGRQPALRREGEHGPRRHPDDERSGDFVAEDPISLNGARPVATERL